MLKKPTLLLTINDENKLSLQEINSINEKILSSENFDDSLVLSQKDLSCFNIILKLADNNTYSMIDFILKNFNKKYKEKKFEGKERTKYFIIKQILLLFIYLSKQKQELSRKQIYEDLYQFILKIHSSLNFIDIKDLIENIRFNIIISMSDLTKKHIIFFASLNFLIEFYKTKINQNTKNENEMNLLYTSIYKILERIYKNISNNTNNLIFLQRYDTNEDLSLLNILVFYNNLNEPKIKGIIDKILLLIYTFNYRKLINDNILENIKEGFYELKKGNDIIIKNIINLLKNKTYMIHNLYKNEINLTENEIYFPKNYFVFNHSEESGINYNTEFDLFNYNFLLIFSFKCPSLENNNYPLITFLKNDEENKESEILLNLSLENRHLKVIYQEEYQEIKEYEIKSNKANLIVIEFYKNKTSKDKLKLTINNEELRKGMNFSPIIYEGKVSINLGYINNKEKINYPQLNNLSLNYQGIIGPVMFLVEEKQNIGNISTSKLIEENSILTSTIFKLKGFYETFIDMNGNFDLKNMLIYEKEKIFNKIKNDKDKKRKMEYFIISPLSMINSICTDTNIFINYFNNLKVNIDSNKETFLKTISIPSKYNGATFAKISLNTIQSFVQNDGIHLLSLILEYYYNILKMIIEYTDYNDYENKLSVSSEINEAMIPIMNLITEIIMYFNIEPFKNDLDTFGFSLMKTLTLLGDISNLKNELVQCFIDNINLLLKYNNQRRSNIIKEFLIKLFVLLCNTKYFDISNPKQLENIFGVFHDILFNSNDTISKDIFISITRFSYVLSHEINKEKAQEFKLMQKAYKSLIELIVNQNQSITFYKDFLNLLVQKGFSVKEKYIFLKIFYKNNKIIPLIYSFDYNDSSSSNDSEKMKKKQEKNKKELQQDKKPFHLNLTISIELMSIYNNILEKIPSIRSKNKPTNKKYHELLKSLLIQLIYEQALLTLEVIPEKDYSFFSSNNLLKAKGGKDIIVRGMIRDRTIKVPNNTKMQIKPIRPKKTRSSFTTDNNKENLITFEFRRSESNKYLFDNLLKDNSISFNVVKSLFSCLFDDWDKNEKFKFIKDGKSVEYEKFNSMFGPFNKNKKELFSQILEIFDLINEDEEKEKVINLLFHFLVLSVDEYKSIEINKSQSTSDIKYIKQKFFHLFESKYIINKIFDFYFSNQKNITNNYFLQNIIYICNYTLEYHPVPFVFSFLKRLLRNEEFNHNFNVIFIGISEFIYINLNIDSEKKEQETEDQEDQENILKRSNVIAYDDENKNESRSVNTYLYFNEIRLIKCLIKAFRNNPKQAKKILEENDYKFLFVLQKLIIAFASSSFIYNLNLYVFHPSSLENISQIETESNSQDKKAKEKNFIKILQTPQAKLLTNQILFIDILDFSFLIVYILWIIPSNNDNSNTSNINEFIKPIIEKIYIQGHFISFYLDIFNTKNVDKNISKENINNTITKNILEHIPMKYFHWLEKNIETKDIRLFSGLAYIIITKYASYLKEKNKDLNNNFDIIRGLFDGYIKLFQIDLSDIMKYYSKIKDRKKTEIILEKEELNNKEFRIQKNYYKLLMTFLSKTKNLNSDCFKPIRTDLEKKYLKDEEENKLNENNNKSEINEEKSKDSFYKYFQEEDTSINNLNSNNKIEMKYSNKSIDISGNLSISREISNNNINNKKDISFFYAKDPVLCTKRDLLLKKFGYYFFEDYFKDERFIKMKNYFLKLYPPSNPDNNYNYFEKQMKIEYSSILKNFSTCDNYFPRLFLRPDLQFFQNQNLIKSHEYLINGKKKKGKNDNITNLIMEQETSKIFHFEYSHGLLNQDNFNLFTVGNTKENISSSNKCIECEHIYNKNIIQGKLKLVDNMILFQNNNSFDISLYSQKFKYRLSSRKEDIKQCQKQIIIPLNLIEQIIYRNFLFYKQALEIFLFNGKSYFFNLYEFAYLEDFIQDLKALYEYWEINIPEIITDPIDYFHKKNYTKDWQENKISTLKYLLLINKFTGRTYNDLSTYLIFPWILNDYTDIKNKEHFRKMQYSMAIQDEEHLEIVKKDYENDKDSKKKSHFVYHYSNSANICLYLLRLNPFTYTQIKLNGHFDSPYRQIESMQDMCYVLREFKESSELVPEYFFMVECLLNLNFNFFGEKATNSGKKSIVNNVKLNIDFSTLLELIMFHKSFLNSDEVGENINKWIDNIFGENQLTNKKNIINKYPVGCYSKYVKEEVDKINSQVNNSNPSSDNYNSIVKQAIKDIKEKTDHAYLFGQCPPQLFQKSHPQKIIQTNELDEECECPEPSSITITCNKKVLYLSCKNENNNIFILTNDEIIIYDKLLSFIQTIKIKKLNLMFSSSTDLDEEKELFNKFSYKNLIFEIDDCKIFFIGGYFDNSLNIYFNNNTKLSFITESRITCMQKLSNKNIFLTGHINGKIIKWKYDLSLNQNNELESIDNSSRISISKISSVIGHNSLIQKIEVNEELNIIISASNDGLIIIRKLFDFEFLNFIRYNNAKMFLIDLRLDNQIVLATYYNKKEKDDINKKIQVNTYSVNGIKLGTVKRNITMPFVINYENDKIFVFIKKILYEVYVTFKEWELLFDINRCKEKGEENSEIISYGYDTNQKILYCLFENRKLLKVVIQEDNF